MKTKSYFIDDSDLNDMKPIPQELFDAMDRSRQEMEDEREQAYLAEQVDNYPYWRLIIIGIIFAVLYIIFEDKL